MNTGKKRPGMQTPIWKLVCIDFVIFVVAVLVFALFHHVLPRRETLPDVKSVRPTTQQSVEVVQATATAQPQAVIPAAPITVQPAAPAEALTQELVTAEPSFTPEPTQLPPPDPDPVGYFGTKFVDMFTDGTIVQSDKSYKSGNLNVTLTPYDENGVQFIVADIYLKDISCLQNIYAQDTIGRGFSEEPDKAAKRVDALLLVNGDYYGLRDDGLLLRNGQLGRELDHTDRDVCILYWNGKMETLSPYEFNLQAEIDKGAYQIWNFGPMLLDRNGQSMESFNSEVWPRNPRTVIGYYEPGHYCLVVIDGRSGHSSGISLENLSKLMKSLGCTRAYNLDGGKTSQMVWYGKVVNNPYDGGRKCSDFIAIVDRTTA